MPRIVPRIVSWLDSQEPSAIKLITAPLIGLVFIMFMPAVGFVLTLHALWKFLRVKFA